MAYSLDSFQRRSCFCLDGKIHLLIFHAAVLYGIWLSVDAGLNYYVHLSIAFIFMLGCTWGNIPRAITPALWDKSIELNLEILIFCHRMRCAIPLSLCAHSRSSSSSSSSSSSLFFFSTQRSWMGEFTSTRTSSCATPTPSTGGTSSRTPTLSCWWCRPTTATSGVSSALGCAAVVKFWGINVSRRLAVLNYRPSKLKKKKRRGSGNYWYPGPGWAVERKWQRRAEFVKMRMHQRIVVKSDMVKRLGFSKSRKDDMEKHSLRHFLERSVAFL